MFQNTSDSIMIIDAIDLHMQKLIELKKLIEIYAKKQEMINQFNRINISDCINSSRWNKVFKDPNRFKKVTATRRKILLCKINK